MAKSDGSANVLAAMTIMESAEFAAEQIRKAIIAGALKPGDRLVEQQLTDMINVSRHPVRRPCGC